jgi:predicted lipid-binding transport protein (Tim44 family)
MKLLMTLAMAALTAGTMVAAEIADAKRLGGGRSLGAQRQATPPPAAPSAPAAVPSTPSGAAANPVMPVQPGAAAAAKAAPSAAAPAKSGASRWLGPVAGLAAGLGLAALASHLGIAEEMLSLILVALVALAAFALVRAFLARRSPASARPLEYAGSTAGAGTVAAPPAPADAPVFGGARSAQEAAASPATAAPRIPAGFAVEPFLKQARLQFGRVQDAYDKGDRDALADVMTPELFAEVSNELSARSGHVATEVVALSADLLEVVTEGNRHWASVRFRGLVREDGEPMPRPLDEIWNLSKPADGSSGWLLAGIQQPDQQPASV